MRTIGENIDKTAFTSSARKKKKDSIFLKNFFENEFLKDMEIYQKKTNWRVRGTLNQDIFSAEILVSRSRAQFNFVFGSEIPLGKTFSTVVASKFTLRCQKDQFLLYTK